MNYILVWFSHCTMADRKSFNHTKQKHALTLPPSTHQQHATILLCHFVVHLFNDDKKDSDSSVHLTKHFFFAYFMRFLALLHLLKRHNKNLPVKAQSEASAQARV